MLQQHIIRYFVTNLSQIYQNDHAVTYANTSFVLLLESGVSYLPVHFGLYFILNPEVTCFTDGPSFSCIVISFSPNSFLLVLKISSAFTHHKPTNRWTNAVRTTSQKNKKKNHLTENCILFISHSLVLCARWLVRSSGEMLN